MDYSSLCVGAMCILDLYSRLRAVEHTYLNVSLSTMCVSFVQKRPSEFTKFYVNTNQIIFEHIPSIALFVTENMSCGCGKYTNLLRLASANSQTDFAVFKKFKQF